MSSLKYLRTLNLISNMHTVMIPQIHVCSKGTCFWELMVYAFGDNLLCVAIEKCAMECQDDVNFTL